jgi:N-acetylglucosamine malate deacetylase 1
MPDHEMTSYVARAAAFAAPVPNYLRASALATSPPPSLALSEKGRGGEGEKGGVEAAAPLERIPHLYYADAVEGKDPLGREIKPGFYIDISNVIETKAEMLACHASQRNWLRKHHGMDHYIQTMRDVSAQQGRRSGAAFAEGFRQHLGHSYPQDNLLGSVLGALVPK